MTKPPEPPTNAEEAFAEFLALQETSGTAPPRFEEWVRRYPEHEAALRQLESDWHGFDALLHGALGRDSSESVFHRTPYAGPAPKSFVEFSSERVIGDFRLIQRIGQGGMGEVWEAEQLSLRRKVALKFIRPDRLNARAEAYFDREARASGRLNHPGIVSVHATGREGPLHWIAQELVPGSSSLNDFLKAVHAEHELPRDYFDRVARFVAELCDALQAAHASDVIHRDVKPHNILITRDDHPKLTDFGLARLTDEAALSGSYVVKGTPIYMSPEQVLGKTKLIDHRTDVFSTGAVLFEMLTLRRAFEGESSQVMTRILTADAPDPRKVRPEVPAELGAIAQKALERRPSDRYLTAAEMAEDLRRYLGHLPVHARPAGPVRRAAKWSRRHPTATSVATLGFLLTVTTWTLRDQVERASERSREAEKQVILTRAWRAIDSGDLEGAAAETIQYSELFPGDPQGHLVMAAGYARRMRQMDMERELARAQAIGGLEDAVGGESAMGLYLQALQWIATEKSASYGRVLQNLERALEMDPKLEVAFFLLYGVRKEVGDLVGARAALEDYRGILRTKDPAVRFVDVLLAELDEDYELALARLEALRAEIGDTVFSEIRGFRALGRVLLSVYLLDREKHSARLEEAEAALVQGARDVPEDAWTWANLALVHQAKCERTQNLDQRREALWQVVACAHHALEADSEVVAAWEALAWAAWQRLMVADPDSRAERKQDLLAALDGLTTRGPESSLLHLVLSELAAQDGMDAYAAGEVDRAVSLFEESARHHPSQVRGRLMLGEISWMRGNYQESLGHLRDAEKAWDLNAQLGAEPAPGLRFAIFVWSLGAADKIGEEDLAFEYLERAREMWLAKEDVDFPEAVSLAEFVALPNNVELRDCDLAREILAAYSSSARGEEQAALMEKIRAACD